MAQLFVSLCFLAICHFDAGTPVVIVLLWYETAFPDYMDWRGMVANERMVDFWILTKPNISAPTKLPPNVYLLEVDDFHAIYGEVLSLALCDGLVYARSLHSLSACEDLSLTAARALHQRSHWDLARVHALYAELALRAELLGLTPPNAPSFVKYAYWGWADADIWFGDFRSLVIPWLQDGPDVLTGTGLDDYYVPRIESSLSVLRNSVETRTLWRVGLPSIINDLMKGHPHWHEGYELITGPLHDNKSNLTVRYLVGASLQVGPALKQDGTRTPRSMRHPATRVPAQVALVRTRKGGLLVCLQRKYLHAPLSLSLGPNDTLRVLFSDKCNEPTWSLPSRHCLLPCNSKILNMDDVCHMNHSGMLGAKHGADRHQEAWVLPTSIDVARGVAQFRYGLPRSIQKNFCPKKDCRNESAPLKPRVEQDLRPTGCSRSRIHDFVSKETRSLAQHLRKFQDVECSPLVAAHFTSWSHGLHTYGRPKWYLDGSLDDVSSGSNLFCIWSGCKIFEGG